MSLVFHLSAENIALARAEMESLYPGPSTLDGRLLFLDAPFNPVFTRLAFTHKIYRLLFQASYANFLDNFRSFAWETVCKGSFSIRSHGSFPEKELASLVWKSVKNPKVDLARPKTAIEVISGKKIYACLLLHQSTEKFGKRKAHLRPGFQPVSLHPKLARSLVNLTGIRKGALIDPLCGTGGILIEAGLMGLRPVGYDIGDAAIGNCRKNLDFFRIKGRIAKRDATSIKEPWNYVATDLPYGRSTNVGNLNDFYISFLHNLKRNLKRRAVVVFPNFVDCKNLARKSKLKIRKELSFYIHKSLTRKIVVLEP